MKPELLFDPEFVTEPMFDWLVAHVEWDERMRARKTASFGLPYNYSDMTYPERDMPEQLVELCDAIESKVGWRPNNCLINYYPDGNASMGFHADAIDNLVGDSGIAIVSVGSERDIVFRSTVDGTEFRKALPTGSLLVMGQDVQKGWKHAIPKCDSGPRISLTFRQLRPTDNTA